MWQPAFPRSSAGLGNATILDGWSANRKLGTQSANAAGGPTLGDSAALSVRSSSNHYD